VPIEDVVSARVVDVRPHESVRAAIARMLDENVGAVAVCDGTRLVGIFTERDVLRLAGEGADLSALKVEDVMTTDVVKVSPDDDVLAAARLMGERHIRHLPVVQGENLVGVAGIRDVLAAVVETVWRTGDPTARETARELLRRRRRT
jgi:CBS domain-containing protein